MDEYKPTYKIYTSNYEYNKKKNEYIERLKSKDIAELKEFLGVSNIEAEENTDEVIRRFKYQLIEAMNII